MESISEKPKIITGMILHCWHLPTFSVILLYEGGKNET